MEDQNLALRIFLSVVGILGVFGNGLACVVIARVRFMHTLTNGFIFNQALIDLLGSVTLLSSRLVVPTPEPFPQGDGGALLCVLWVTNVFVFQMFFTSTFNLVALTLERYLAIVFPFRYQLLGTRRNAIMVILGVWVSAFLFNSFGFFIQYYEDGQCKQTLVAHPEVLGVAIITITYAIPVAVMMVVYVHITVVLKREAARVEPTVATASAGDRQQGAGPSVGTAPEGQGESLMRARRNTFKTLLTVCVAFTVCWTPNEIIFFLFNLGAGVDLSSPVYICSVGLAASNGCINPFIYAIKYRQFRKALKTLLGFRNQTEMSLAAVSSRHR
ncbi:galanin receptor type 2-like [Acanthaster planci]|uniref:Galanin receptor type 2-like n=1 Tax=Acanthaster planci TaxID=133434 RepID=A0A8B7YMP2_ACAPL|nr:galanin receptor type 2-like [Acanthaster planci]